MKFIKNLILSILVAVIFSPLLNAMQPIPSDVQRDARRVGEIHTSSFRLKNNDADEFGHTKLHLAVLLNALDLVQISLRTSTSATIDSQDNKGCTPLHFAVKVESDLIINELLKANANPNVQDNEGNTPLHWAAILGANKFVFATLLEKPRIEVNRRNHQGRTPLYYTTCYAVDKNITDMLRARGATK